MRPYVRVQHIDHAEGQVVGTFNPLQPRFAHRLNDIGDVSYELALSNPSMTRDQFAPKRTDYRLQVSRTGSDWHNIQAGFHWPVGLNNEEGTVKLQGMDWMAYLDQPMWFDAYLIDAMDLISGKTKMASILDDASAWGRAWIGTSGTDTDAVHYNATQQSVVQDLVDSIANGNDGTIKINAAFAGTSGWEEVLEYVVMFQDSTTILDHIKAIAAMDDPFGFDFYMEPDKTLRLFNPAVVASLGDIPIDYIITRESEALVSLNWQNNGPVATHTVGIGPGSPGIWAQKTYAPSVDVYRRWLRLVNLGGNYRMPDQVKYAVHEIPDRFPQKELKITLKPDELDPVDPTAFFFPAIGRAIYVDIDFPPYHRINANFWITAQEFHTDDEGNWLCDVSLQQIYDPSGIG